MRTLVIDVINQTWTIRDGIRTLWNTDGYNML